MLPDILEAGVVPEVEVGICSACYSTCCTVLGERRVGWAYKAGCGEAEMSSGQRGRLQNLLLFWCVALRTQPNEVKVQVV